MHLDSSERVGRPSSGANPERSINVELSGRATFPVSSKQTVLTNNSPKKKASLGLVLCPRSLKFQVLPTAFVAFPVLFILPSVVAEQHLKLCPLQGGCGDGIENVDLGVLGVLGPPEHRRYTLRLHRPNYRV